MREMHRDRLQRELSRSDPNTRIDGGGRDQLEFVEGEGILLLLSEKGICAFRPRQSLTSVA